MVGRGFRKGARMMRKSEYALWALLVLAVLAAGSTMVSLARSQSASAANSEIYRQLDLFGEVLERVRADYVEKPDDSKLIEPAINGMLTALDKEQIQGLTLQEAVEKMRGPVNSPITLTIVRKGVDDPFDVKVTRDVIRINAVKAHNEGDAAYIT